MSGIVSLMASKTSRWLRGVPCERIKAMLAPFSTTAQNMEVFTDGDNQLRQWQQSTLPGSRHILDWYHLRRRVNKLNRVVHSKETAHQLKHADHDRLSELVDAIQWSLWHGRSCQAIRKLEIMQMVLSRITTLHGCMIILLVGMQIFRPTRLRSLKWHDPTKSYALKTHRGVLHRGRAQSEREHALLRQHHGLTQG